MANVASGVFPVVFMLFVSTTFFIPFFCPSSSADDFNGGGGGGESEEEEKISSSVSSTVDETCSPIHSRAWGMTLACCGPSAPLPRDCKYNTVHLCTYVSCTCALIVEMDKVNCADNVAVSVWKDHEAADDAGPFLCRNPNFPNAEAEFSATLHFGVSKRLSDEFYLGLSRYKITELELSFQSIDQLPEQMFTYFRNVKRLKLWQHPTVASQTPSNNAARRNSLQQQQRRLFRVGGVDDLPKSFAGVKQLEMLTLQNVSVLVLPDSAAFAESLRYLQIHNSGLKTLPEFLKRSSRLEYLKITRTNLTEIGLIGAFLPSLKLCFLSHNKIRDLSEVRFDNRQLRDLDLSYNQISSISPDTFDGLVSLTFLDLSNNYLKRLPNGVFSNLRQLKWLYINHDFNPVQREQQQRILRNSPNGFSLETLNAQHFVGLVNLEYLSLANNPSLRFDPTTLAPLDNLLSLDLKHCNLSTIPETITHLCRLKYLWLNFNNLRTDASYPPQIFAHLVERLDELDVNENALEENARSFFLIPTEKINLIESLLFALKQQSVWWRDQCVSYHWFLHLIELNKHLNETLKSYYQSKFAFTSNQTLTPYEKQLCNAGYAKIVRDLKPFSKMAESGACFRLNQEKAVNHQLRRQLVQLSRSKDGHYLNVASSVVENLLVNNNSNFAPSSDFECNRNVTNETRKGDQAEEDEHDCRHLYDNVNLLGYLLAANFAVLLIVCLCCVITFCKRQSSSSNWRD